MKKQILVNQILGLVFVAMLASMIISPIGAGATTYPMLALAPAHLVPASPDDDDSGWIRTDEVLPFFDLAANACQPNLEEVQLVGEAHFITKMRTDDKGIT